MKTVTRLAILLLTAVCLPVPPHAQSKNDRFKEQLEPIIKQAVAKGAMPGFAIAIVENQKIVYAAGFGVRNLDKKGDAITPQSLFHMASITKPFVATSIMQLWEQGKIDLDAPLVKYLPYFRMKDERYRVITLRQMLSHISGMPDVSDYEWDKPQYDDDALDRYVRSLGNLSLIAAPGTKYRYSNMAFEILGDVVAKVSGESFEAYVKHHILEPLGMNSSTLLVKEADPKLLTSPHVVNSDFDLSVSPVFPYNRIHSPSSTLYSNVLDMSRWAMANLNHGELDGKRILKASTLDTMWKPAGEQWEQIGISWFLGEYKGHATIGHSGRDVGFRSNLLIVPDKSIAVVMMSNFDSVALQPLTNAALDITLGLRPDPVVIKPPRPPITRVLYETIARDGLDAGVKQYYDLKTNHSDAYDFGEALMNNLGYTFLNAGKTKEAIRIFQLNVEAYPASANVYDSLAEGYMRNGEKALAVEYYEKSLKLNPGNSNAVEMIKKLKE